MRIMILSSLYPPYVYGGAEKAAAHLAEALVAKGNAVSVVTLHPKEDEVIETLNGVKIYRMPMPNLYWPFGAQAKRPRLKRLVWHLRDMWNREAAKRVGHILDLERPEVVNSHLIVGLSVSVWREVKKRGIRMVHTMHDYYLLCPQSNIFKHGKTCEQQCFACRAFTLTQRKSMRNVDSVVSVSNFTLDAHRSWGYFRNTEGSVIYNVATFPEPAQSVYVDPDPGHLVFGFIGQLLESKGIRVLLEATKHLKNPRWKLRIAGTGVKSYVQALKDEYPDPRIEWLGFCVADDFYKSIHVTIVPSVWPEPLGYVIIESLLYGRSIICSDIGGMPEITLLGKKAKLFAANDCQGLSNLMDEAIEHRDEWMLGGFREISSGALFSQEEVVERYRCVYRGDAQDRVP